MDIEERRRESEEIKKAFAEMFPLVHEHSLPTAACHIKRFLAKRIEDEVKRENQEFVGRLVRVLCEVAQPHSNVIDIAREVVEKCKGTQYLRDKIAENLLAQNRAANSVIQAEVDDDLKGTAKQEHQDRWHEAYGRRLAIQEVAKIVGVVLQ